MPRRFSFSLCRTRAGSMVGFRALCIESFWISYNGHRKGKEPVEKSKIQLIVLIFYATITKKPEKIIHFCGCFDPLIDF